MPGGGAISGTAAAGAWVNGAGRFGMEAGPEGGARLIARPPRGLWNSGGRDRRRAFAEQLRRGRVWKHDKQRDRRGQKPPTPARFESMFAPENHGTGFSPKTRQIQASGSPHDPTRHWKSAACRLQRRRPMIISAQAEHYPASHTLSRIYRVCRKHGGRWPVGEFGFA